MRPVFSRAAGSPAPEEIGLAKSVGRALPVLVLLLAFAGIASALLQHSLGWTRSNLFIRLFELDDERNIPTMFAVLLLLLAAVLLVRLSVIAELRRAPDLSKWAVLAGIFLVMAIDEAASLHEWSGPPVRGLLGEGSYGVLYFAWVIPGMVAVVAIATFFSRFLLRLPRRTRWAFLVAGAFYVGGALGMELLGGYFYELGGRNLCVRLLAVGEETLEMVGAVLFVRALLDYGRRYAVGALPGGPSEANT